MTKEFIYKNISKLEEFARKHTTILDIEERKNINFDEIVISDEARGTCKNSNFFVQFCFSNNYTEIAEIDEYIVIVNLLVPEDEDEAKETNKSKSKDEIIKKVNEKLKLYKTDKMLSYEFYDLFKN